MQSEYEKIRQTTINAARELGKYDFDTVVHFFDTGLFDENHSVQRAVNNDKINIENNTLPRIIKGYDSLVIIPKLTPAEF